MDQEQRLSAGEIAQLLELVSSISEERGYSPSEVIDLIARLMRPSCRGSALRRPILADFAERLRRLRIRRNELVGADLFRDPAWDMLLALFSAHERGTRISVSSLCYASGVPASTAMRHLARLEEHGLVVRQGDTVDMRRQFVKATPKALDDISRLAIMLIEESQATHGPGGRSAAA